MAKICKIARHGNNMQDRQHSGFPPLNLGGWKKIFTFCLQGGQLPSEKLGWWQLLGGGLKMANFARGGQPIFSRNFFFTLKKTLLANILFPHSSSVYCHYHYSFIFWIIFTFSFSATFEMSNFFAKRKRPSRFDLTDNFCFCGGEITDWTSRGGTT